MHNRSLIFIFFLIVTINAQAQQNNIWYFGRKAGIDFNPGPAGAVPNVLANSQMLANEGCASICDNTGALLFYTNGVTIYNKEHNVMLNGDGLLGNISSVQSSVIVPQPNNDSIYYLFTSDAIENGYANGYRYSVINMRHDGGKGEVVDKNVLLSSSCTERMIAARHADGVSVWLITNDNNSNTFRSWLVTCTGIQPAQVSNAGVVLNQHLYTNTGMMKVSPDGKQLCQTHFPAADETTNPNFCQLFDFDNLTGIVSNARMITFPATQIIACEYSPDSKLLYLTCPGNHEIAQIEATLGTAANIIASRVKIPTPSAGFFGIQLAPDNKIYLAQPASNLSVIKLPNVKGTGCNYTPAVLEVSPGSSFIGFPSFINDFSASPDNGFRFNIVDSCAGKVQFNGTTTMAGPITWDWDFGDGNHSALQNPLHTYLDPLRTYVVKIKITSAVSCGYIERTKTVFPGGMIIDAKFSFVAKCDSGYVRFVNESSIFPAGNGVSMVWDFGDGHTSTDLNPKHSYTDAGVYPVKLSITTNTPCLNKTVTHDVNLEVLHIQVPPTITVDPGEEAHLFVTGGGSVFTWSPATGLSDPTIANPTALPPRDTKYKVVVRNDAGCSDSAYVLVKVNPVPGIYVPTGFTPNNDGKNDVFRPTITKEFDLHEFSIYNRWGQKIYTTKTKGEGWNGKLTGVENDSNVFIWILRATDTRNGKKYDLKGTFVIVR